MDECLDSDYQPPKEVNQLRVQERTIDELIGICKGLLADERLSDKDIEFLRGWLFYNKDFFVFGYERDIYNKVMSVLGKSGPVADENTLYQTLEELYGGKADVFLTHSLSTKLPFTNPVPRITPGMTVCFTGKMSYGPRDICKALSKVKGFLCVDHVVTGIDCLVVGNIGSRDWMHTTHGRKIEKVVSFNKYNKLDIKIISEATWLQAMHEYPDKE